MSVLETVLDRLSADARIDAAARPISAAVTRVVGPRPVRDALSGTGLGHPLHPALVALPLGAWFGAAVLDLLPGARARQGADALVLLGIAGAGPAAATGLNDWSDTSGASSRIGAVHAAATATAVALHTASAAARRRGHRGAGRALSLTGTAAVGVGGYLGGHLAYRLGVGTDHTVGRALPADWTTVARSGELDGCDALTVQVDGTAVLLLRTGEAAEPWTAMVAVCSHLGGPLQDGPRDGDCVTCPWHGSVFRARDGAVIHGPATAPQPVGRVRIDGQDVQIRAA